MKCFLYALTNIYVYSIYSLVITKSPFFVRHLMAHQWRWPKAKKATNKPTLHCYCYCCCCLMFISMKWHVLWRNRAKCIFVQTQKGLAQSRERIQRQIRSIIKHEEENDEMVSLLLLQLKAANLCILCPFQMSVPQQHKQTTGILPHPLFLFKDNRKDATLLCKVETSEIQQMLLDSYNFAWKTTWNGLLTLIIHCCCCCCCDKIGYDCCQGCVMRHAKCICMCMCVYVRCCVFMCGFDETPNCFGKIKY